MEAVSDVLNLDVKQVLKVKLINVSAMEVVSDVLNLVVKQVLKVKLINVLHMEVVHVVLIVLIGLIPAVVLQNMTVIAQLVSNVFFQMMIVVKLFIYIQKKLW